MVSNVCTLNGLIYAELSAIKTHTHSLADPKKSVCAWTVVLKAATSAWMRWTTLSSSRLL